MAKLELEDDLKLGREEILLDPTKKANKCGSFATALTANDIVVVVLKGTTTPVPANTNYDSTLHDRVWLVDCLSCGGTTNNPTVVTVITDEGGD